MNKKNFILNVKVKHLFHCKPETEVATVHRPFCYDALVSFSLTLSTK